jgi:hypothetical protein
MKSSRRQSLIHPSTHRRAARRFRIWIKAQKAQQAHLHAMHWNGVPDCICEQSVWYFEAVYIARLRELPVRQYCVG